jgi:hypothetical protein
LKLTNKIFIGRLYDENLRQDIFFGQLLLIMLWLIPTFSYAEVTCHIHSPEVTKQNTTTKKLIGPFSSQQTCEIENEHLYQLKGRCHCSFANSGKPFIYNDFNSKLNRKIPIP